MLRDDEFARLVRGGEVQRVHSDHSLAYPEWLNVTVVIALADIGWEQMHEYIDRAQAEQRRRF